MHRATVEEISHISTQLKEDKIAATAKCKIVIHDSVCLNIINLVRTRRVDLEHADSRIELTHAHTPNLIKKDKRK